ncbi:hypothetical protein HMPREF1986_01729, partial [Oribacterium sp. oral taxon 078 str. F0263]
KRRGGRRPAFRRPKRRIGGKNRQNLISLGFARKALIFEIRNASLDSEPCLPESQKGGSHTIEFYSKLTPSRELCHIDLFTSSCYIPIILRTNAPKV